MDNCETSPVIEKSIFSSLRVSKSGIFSICLTLIAFTLFWGLRIWYWKTHFELPFSDMTDFEDITKRILGSFCFGHSEFWQSYKAPTLPVLGAIVFGIFGEGHYGAWRFFQGILVCGGAGWLAWEIKIFCRANAPAVIFLWCIALSKASIFWSYKFATESVAEAFMYLMAAGFLCSVRTRSRWMVFLTGGIVTASVLNRPNYMAAIPCVLFVLFLIRKRLAREGQSPWRALILFFVSFLLGVALVWSPWIIRGYRLYGHLLLTNTSGGHSFVFDLGRVTLVREDGTVESKTNDELLGEAPSRWKNDYESHKNAQKFFNAWVKEDPIRYLRVIRDRFNITLREHNVYLTKLSRIDLFEGWVNGALIDKTPWLVLFGVVGLLILAYRVSWELFLLPILSMTPWWLAILVANTSRYLDPLLPLVLSGVPLGIWALLFYKRGTVLSVTSKNSVTNKMGMAAVQLDHTNREQPSVKPTHGAPEYSVLILTKNEADNLKSLLPQINEVLGGVGASYEIVIMDAKSSDGTADVARGFGATVHAQVGKGYGAAFREGIAKCRGEWILALDADHSHPPQFLRAMIANKEGVDLLISSRYVPGGDANMEGYRNILSRILGMIFGQFLGIPVRDVSSGFRMYRRSVVSEIDLVGRDFDVLIETLIKVIAGGFRVREIPFIYEPRVFGNSNARLFKFAISYLRTLKRMWNLRNSVESADYEERAYRSIIPLQRYWQRKRVRNILELADRNQVTVDIGSGASRAARALPRVIAVDKNRAPLRFLKANGVHTVQGSLENLPFPSDSISQVVLSNVLQHVVKRHSHFGELSRIVTRGGVVIVATPDYGSGLWRTLEAIHTKILPHAPGSLHVSRYTKEEIRNLLVQSGFVVEEERSILGAEYTFKARKK